MIEISIKKDNEDEKVYIDRTSKYNKFKIAIIILAFYTLHKRLSYDEYEIAKLKKIIEELKPKKGA